MSEINENNEINGDISEVNEGDVVNTVARIGEDDEVYNNVGY